MADNLRRSPARPLREVQGRRQIRKAALSVRVLEWSLRGGVQSKLGKHSVRVQPLVIRRGLLGVLNPAAVASAEPSFSPGADGEIVPQALCAAQGF